MTNIENSVMQHICAIVESLGCEIVEVEFKKKENGDNLTVFIDKVGGVTLDDCERVHNAIDAPLDELDPTNGKPYTLNVSSPGLDRPIKSDRDYERNIGQKIEINLYAAIEKKKRFCGKLVGFDENFVTVEVDGKERKFERSSIAKATKFIL